MCEDACSGEIGGGGGTAARLPFLINLNCAYKDYDVPRNYTSLGVMKFPV